MPKHQVSRYNVTIAACMYHATVAPRKAHYASAMLAVASALTAHAKFAKALAGLHTARRVWQANGYGTPMPRQYAKALTLCLAAQTALQAAKVAASAARRGVR